MDRRNRGEAGREHEYVSGSAGEPAPLPVRLWQQEVYKHGIYDLEVDTSELNTDVSTSRS